MAFLGVFCRLSQEVFFLVTVIVLKVFFILVCSFAWLFVCLPVCLSVCSFVLFSLLLLLLLCGCGCCRCFLKRLLNKLVFDVFRG